MDGIRAGWNKALRSQYCSWIEKQPLTRQSKIGAPARGGWLNRHSFRQKNRHLPRQSCGNHWIHPSKIPDCEGAAQRRRDKKNEKLHRCPADSCAVHHCKTD